MTITLGRTHVGKVYALTADGIVLGFARLALSRRTLVWLPPIDRGLALIGIFSSTVAANWREYGRTANAGTNPAAALTGV